jgi:hypothetical protein
MARDASLSTKCRSRSSPKRSIHETFSRKPSFLSWHSRYSVLDVALYQKTDFGGGRKAKRGSEAYLAAGCSRMVWAAASSDMVMAHLHSINVSPIAPSRQNPSFRPHWQGSNLRTGPVAYPDATGIIDSAPRRLASIVYHVELPSVLRDECKAPR